MDPLTIMFMILIVFLLGFSLGIIKGVHIAHAGQHQRAERMYRM